MSDTIVHRALTGDERKSLIGRGCTASDWHRVQVEGGFDPRNVQNVHFAGQVKIGKVAALSNATLVDCFIGRGVRIANVGVRIANYHIADGTCVEDVGVIETRPGASFGNGVDVSVLNEGGGREVILFNELSAQFAHLMCFHRDPPLAEKLAALARDEAAHARCDVGAIGAGAVIRSVKEIIDVNIGEKASVCSATRLINGTVLSTGEAPTIVGADVQAEEFIIAEGSTVTSGALLAKTFIGQGCQVGKQFSAENVLFFANCEAFHGEAISTFAGPFTATHHKSTLLIAGLFSFYNAGSGTNQSNHMYKLGPVHEGKLERGTKTGSFSYVMWPCRVGPFSVVLGKHTRNFDTANLPFSLIEASPEGRCLLVPGLNLNTVGVVRDGAKWPSRDRRGGSVKRDRICFDVFSPYTVGRMLKGCAILEKYQEATPKAVDTVTIGGADVKRVLLRTSRRYYRNGIELYLREKVVERAERAIDASESFTDAFATAEEAAYSEDWVDISGQLMPRRRLHDLVHAVASGVVDSVEQFHAELDKITAAYREDEWVWVKIAYEQVFGRGLDRISEDDVVAIVEAYVQAKDRYLKHILADAQKEFSERAQIGFGQDREIEDAAEDFTQVRGTYEQSKFVRQIRDEQEALRGRMDLFRRKLQRV